MSEVEEIPIKSEIIVQNNTQLATKCVIFTWSVSNFSLHSQFPQQKICSPDFMLTDIPYQLHLKTVNNDDEDESGVVAISLFKAEKDGIGHFVKYKVSLLDDKGNSLVTQEDELNFTDKRSSGRQLLFCLFENLRDNRRSSLYDDTLHVKCEATFLSQVHSNNTSKVCSVKARSTKKTSSLAIKYRQKRTAKGEFIGNIWFNILFLILTIHFLSSFRMPIKDCREYQQKVNKVVVDSTHQIIRIAEALNLTDVKVKASDFLNAVYEDYNITNIKFPVFNMNVSQISYPSAPLKN